MKKPALGLVVVATCTECGGLRQAALMPGPDAELNLDAATRLAMETAGVRLDEVRPRLLPCATCTPHPTLSVIMLPKIHVRAWSKPVDLPLSVRDIDDNVRALDKLWTRMGLDARPVMMWRSL